MRFTTIILLSLLIPGCEQPAPRVSEAKLQEIKAELPGIRDACLDKIRWGGFEELPDAVDQCFVMTEPSRWRGYWRTGLETSLFCPAPARGCPISDDKIWLSFADPELRKQVDASGSLYAVDFIGRMTVHKGMFGHMGLADREMIVDRMISVREVRE